MKIILWSAFALLALLWTGGAAVLAQLIQWTAQGLAHSSGAPLGTLAVNASVPAWLSAWIDPATWAAAQQSGSAALAGVAGGLPAIGTAVGWLVPAVWATWGLGLVVLLVLTLVAAWLLARLGRSKGPGPHFAA